MAKPYSSDLRARIVRSVEEGVTLEETAERHHVSLSTVVRLLRLKRETGSVIPAQFGGYKRHKLASHEGRIRQWVAEQPDITLAELKANDESEGQGQSILDLSFFASFESDL